MFRQRVHFIFCVRKRKAQRGRENVRFFSYKQTNLFSFLAVFFFRLLKFFNSTEIVDSKESVVEVVDIASWELQFSFRCSAIHFIFSRFLFDSGASLESFSRQNVKSALFYDFGDGDNFSFTITCVCVLLFENRFFLPATVQHSCSHDSNQANSEIIVLFLSFLFLRRLFVNSAQRRTRWHSKFTIVI